MMSFFTIISHEMDPETMDNFGYYYMLIGAAFLLLIMLIMVSRNAKKLKQNKTLTVLDSKSSSILKPKIAHQKLPNNLAQAQGEDLLKKDYIPKEKELEILDKIEEFEKSTLFLKNGFSLNELSLQVGVNHRYLSYVINTHKNRSFNAYINELRIKHIVDCLQNDPKYLQYKISYLAEQSGFSSHNRFTISFKKVTGHSPSAYISYVKRLKSKRNQS
ncbi:helix-turn-helix domain-containing protein [Myroides sp. LJL116]